MKGLRPTTTTVYEKIFSRDYSLPWLQVWYIGEALTPKPWNKQKNPSFPYLIFVRNDNTMMVYYDKSKLLWSRDSVLQEIKKDEKFTDEIAARVKTNLDLINPVFKTGVLKKEELLNYFLLFKKVYPWFLAMWEICEADEEQIGSLNIGKIRELKIQNNTLCNDIDRVIKNSLVHIFPSVAQYIHILTIEEIRSGLLPTVDILEKRDKAFIYTDNILFDYSKLNEIEGQYHIKFQDVSISKKPSLINGSIACRGYTKGFIRRVMGYKNLDEVCEGEILVSPMTMPDFLPAMKKAAAFITDEGGITCHAAILARELNKPCIVGTNIATTVLKNGDFVEVDANKGIVRIINS